MGEISTAGELSENGLSQFFNVSWCRSNTDVDYVYERDMRNIEECFVDYFTNGPQIFGIIGGCKTISSHIGEYYGLPQYRTAF